ncbi:MAG: AlpA family phage regulatory protein [Duganella sp.]
MKSSISSGLRVSKKLVAIHCGLSRATIYNAIKVGNFPQPIKVSGRASAWFKQEVEAWIEQRIADSRRNPK